jgi:hypothetical protein
MTQELAKLKEKLIQPPLTGTIRSALIVNQIADLPGARKSLLVWLDIPVSFIFDRNSPWEIKAVPVCGTGNSNEKTVGPPRIGKLKAVSGSVETAELADAVRIKCIAGCEKGDHEHRRNDTRTGLGEEFSLHVRKEEGFQETDELPGRLVKEFIKRE